MAGIKDVAHAAGVSVSTVSYVLSGKRAISEKTAAKVRDAIRELQYTPDASAQKMRGIRNRILAVSEPIRGDINEAKYNAYFLHTARQARNAGYDVLLLDIVEDDERVAEAGSYGKPCVAIGYPSRKGDCACVDIDFPAAADLAVRYLHGKGHRDVILLRDNERDYERQSGYVLTLRRLMLERAGEMGMRVTESAKNEFGRFDARAFVDGLLKSLPRPTAIISQADADTLNMVTRELENRGIDIPGDISILSCGTFLKNELVAHPVTEIPLMPRLLCSKAVGLLLSAVEDGRTIGAESEFVPPRIEDRGSVCSLNEGDES